MSDFSIELTAERIVDPRARSYFREVYSSYVAGNFRSATVMLWSVVVCDLLFKLEELKATYNDQTATTLLTEVEHRQAANPKSPEWEAWLLDQIKARTRLLEEHEYLALVSIQQHRHLSAHPILTVSYELHSPTPEAVRADMRAALEGVLTKPPLMTKKVFDALVEDIEARKGQFADEDSLRQYLDAKFFSHFLPTISREVFKSLWQVVFTSTDARCVANRAINLRALGFLYDRDSEQFLRLIESDRKRFSKVASDRGAMKSIIEFVSSRPRVYALLTDEAKGPLKDFVVGDAGMLLGWVVFPGGIQEQLTAMEGDRYFSWTACTYEALYKWLEVAQQFGVAPRAAALIARAYAASGNYDTANHRYSLLSIVMDKLTPELMVECLSGIEKNNQTHGRGRAREDHLELKGAADKVLGANFDYSPFPKFLSSLT